MSNAIKKFPLVTVWLVILFVTSGLIINIVELFVLILWPINKSWYRSVISRISYFYFAEITFLAHRWGFIDITFYGKKEDYAKIGKENAIAMPNHTSDIDWMLGWIMAERGGILGGAKCFVKNDLKYMPTMGWIWWCAEYGFLKRDWDKDQRHFTNLLRGLSEYPVPFWIGIFAEGTRMTPAKLKASQEYAVSKGMEPLKHHLLPRPKGFAVSVQILKDSVPAVYDIEVAIPDRNQATIINLIRGQTIKAHMYLRRIEMKSVPTESLESTSEWCRQLFIEKDKLMDHFVNTGMFPAEIVDYPRRPWDFIVVVIWNILIAIPSVSVVKYILMSGSTLLIASAVAVLLFGFVVVKILLGYADINRGSSFGLKKTTSTTEKNTDTSRTKAD